MYLTVSQTALIKEIKHMQNIIQNISLNVFIEYSFDMCDQLLTWV